MMNRLKWDVFQAIFLINLARRTDRRRDLLRELEYVGLQANDEKLVWINAVAPQDAGEFRSIGARGCFLSHLECFKQAASRKLQRILILEDDASFSIATDSERLGAALDHLKSDVSWRIWYGGHYGIGAPKTVPGYTLAAGVVGAHCVAFQGDAITSVLGMLELMLTRQATHPVAGPMDVDGAYDTWRAFNPSQKVIIEMPPLCVQRSSHSDITVRWKTRTPVIRELLTFAHIARNKLRQLRLKKTLTRSP